MLTFEILCVTMHQNDFSKLKEMNINSDVIFANQSNKTSYEEYTFNGHKAKMITTQTKGVGTNRNLALMYATNDICLFADDDVTYVNNVEKIVINEFIKHQDADIIIFNLNSTDQIRKPRRYFKTKKIHMLGRMPWGSARIAFKLNSIKKANLWFSTLFGGGCLFPSGEDSIWLHDAKKKKLSFYISKEIIGTVSYSMSTWFTGNNEKLYYSKGCVYSTLHKKTFLIFVLYAALQKKNINIPFSKRIKWMYNGKQGYKKMLSFEEFNKLLKKN